MSHADKVIEAIKAMTPEERVQSLIRAGIIREDGTLMPQYGGTSTSGDIPTPEMCVCAGCGYQWPRGQDGRHECEPYLLNTIAGLRAELAAATARAEEAERWKSEALQVEREWDPQELAKMLGGTLGESCRMVVQREVPRLLSELDRLRKEVERLRGELLEWQTIGSDQNTQKEIVALRDQLGEVRRDNTRLHSLLAQFTSNA